MWPMLIFGSMPQLLMHSSTSELLGAAASRIFAKMTIDNNSTAPKSVLRDISLPPIDALDGPAALMQFQPDIYPKHLKPQQLRV
jgi:hypothetical protein